MPSLKQLLDAIQAYREEDPDALITVVVDATFGHRIDSSELGEFEAMVNSNELVCPPAGAVGRGDAFVLGIANKVGATILSNDSFQEFHGTHTWLFEEGRLIGGKPVPHIGWVFVARTPVRGPTSRKAVSEAKRKGDRAPRGTVKASAEASLPMPVPATPPPGARLPKPRRGSEEAAAAVAAAAPVTPAEGGRSGSRRGSGRRGASAESASVPTPAAAAERAAAVPSSGREPKPTPKSTGINDLLTFLTFVERHPVGTSVSAVVEHYSSHGAYVTVGEAKAYVPLRSMADPAPRSAREFMKIGESVTLVVESFAPARRSIDLATPLMATVKEPPVRPTKPERAAKAKPEPSAKAKRERSPKAKSADAVQPASVQPETAQPENVQPAPAVPVTKTAKPRRSKQPTTSPVEATVTPPPSGRAPKAPKAPNAARASRDSKTVEPAATSATTPSVEPAPRAPRGRKAAVAPVAAAAAQPAATQTAAPASQPAAARTARAASPAKAVRAAKAAAPVVPALSDTAAASAKRATKRASKAAPGATASAAASGATAAEPAPAAPSRRRRGAAGV